MPTPATMTSNSPAACFAVDTYSYTLQCPVRACLKRLADRGFREFELQMYPGHLWPTQIDQRGRRDMRAFLAGEGLSVTTLNMPNIDLNITAATAEMRGMTLGVLRRIVELAGDLGAEGVVIGPGKANPLLAMPRDQLMELFYRALGELVPVAQNEGVAIFVENMPFAFLSGMHELLSALDAYGHRGIGVVYDVANGHFVKEDVASALTACAPRLRAIHLSDTDQVIYRHAPIGLGTVDFSALPGILAQVGFARRPILEIITPEPDEAIERSARRLVELGFH
ncbi:MAG: TIM barrel protein [Burkholderiales bacterium]|nr:TIM barrel protein [Burkholderiales bacterium]